MYKFQNLPFMKIPSIQPCMDTLNINLFFSFFFWEGNSAVSLMWLINGHAPTCVSHSYMFLDPPVKARSAGWEIVFVYNKTKHGCITCTVPIYMYWQWGNILHKHVRQCKESWMCMCILNRRRCNRPYRELTDKYLVTDFIIENDLS